MLKLFLCFFAILAILVFSIMYSTEYILKKIKQWNYNRRYEKVKGTWKVFDL